MNPDILATIRQLAHERLDIPLERLNDSASLKELGIDSLYAIDLIFAVEDHFRITLGADNIRKVRSLQDIATQVTETMKRTAAQPLCWQADT
jgi:acyl carrier protein